MGGLRINFAEVESSFEPLPEGQYEVVIETVEVRESKSSDNDYLNWQFKVLDDEYEGRMLWMITSLSERALFRLKDVFLALGVIEEDEEIDIEWEEGVDITPQEGPRLINPEVEGLACIAVVTNEMYDGRERNRVNELLESGAPAPTRKASSAKKSSSNGGSKSAAKKSAGKKAAGGRTRKLR